MDCSTPGLPVHHQLLEFTQTHVHWVGDAIHPSHLLLLFFFPSISSSISVSHHLPNPEVPGGRAGLLLFTIPRAWHWVWSSGGVLDWMPQQQSRRWEFLCRWVLKEGSLGKGKEGRRRQGLSWRWASASSRGVLSSRSSLGSCFVSCVILRPQLPPGVRFALLLDSVPPPLLRAGL